jgi:hypothetical protein
MLRYGFLPSDFHPLFLILGDEHDLGLLSGLLRRFSATPQTMDLATEIPQAAARATLHILPANGRYGLEQIGDTAFQWHLNAWQAEQITLRIEALCAAGTKSGSTIIELGVENEIPIKISRGEFTDDYLATRI